MGSPLGTSAVMVGNTLFDVAVGLTSAVPTETHNPDPIDVLTPLRTNKPKICLVLIGGIFLKVQYFFKVQCKFLKVQFKKVQNMT